MHVCNPIKMATPLAASLTELGVAMAGSGTESEHPIANADLGDIHE